MLVNGVVVICLAIVCIILSPLILVMLCAAPRHCATRCCVIKGGGGVGEIINNRRRSQLLACISFLKTYPNEKNVIVRGVSRDVVAVLVMLMPDHNFTIFTVSELKLPYDICRIKTMQDAKPTQALLFCAGTEVNVMKTLHKKIKPIAGAYEYIPTTESFIEYKSIHMPIWTNHKQMESWVICDGSAKVIEYDTNKYKSQMAKYKKQISNEYFQLREDELIDDAITQIYVTDFLLS
jgi:hypothetical protein